MRQVIMTATYLTVANRAIKSEGEREEGRGPCKRRLSVIGIQFWADGGSLYNPFNIWYVKLFTVKSVG